MAATVTAVATPAAEVPGSQFEKPVTVALDSSYPNGTGYVFTAASFGFNTLKKIKNIEPTSLAAAATWVYWLVFTYNADGTIASVALRLAVVSTGVEVANAVNVSTATFNVIVEGR